MKLKLSLTLAAFQGLHATLDKTRRTSKTVTVDREALTALLIDHSKALAELGPSRVEEATS